MTHKGLIGTGVVLALAAALALIAVGGGTSLAADGIIYVDAGATGSNTGEDWTNAYTDLQLALADAEAGEQIWVATGTYKPTDSTDRTISFQMVNGVAIYGGFDPSVGDDTWEERDWQANPTILSGDIGVEGDPADNSYHVFYHPDTAALDSSAILDGFTITGGIADGDVSPYWDGGGMYNSGSSPTLANLTFTSNSASWGGGLYNSDSSSPVLTNCTFDGNSAEADGGGMFNASSSPALTHCTFEGNSATDDGGGLYNQSSSPVLSECTFTANSAGADGGAMYNYVSPPTLANCTFDANSATDNGGGLYNYASSPALTNCTFDGNSANGFGGGMANDWNASPTLTGCIFSDNSANASGGGMYNYISSPALTNCTFSGNSAQYYAGGMINYSNSSPLLTNCTFSGNSANHGGGMYNFYNSAPVLSNCTFSGNSAIYGAGGMLNDSSSPTLTNCTFSGNSASTQGGGMYNYDSSSPRLTNCILWEDSPDEIINANSSPIITYSDIQGGYTGTGNIDADPLFVDPDNGDYHLGLDSPCIDAGTNDAPNLPDYDFEGNPRILDGDGDGEPRVDMGVDEAWGPPPPVIFVDHEAGGANNGTSWDDALTGLQNALDWAVDGVEIWVAAGTYVPTRQFDAGDPRSAAFQMKNGVAIYGGFDPSAGDDTWEERDWQANPTILSGDIGTPDENSDNSYHVFYHPDTAPLDSSAVLDGFTITGGNADGDLSPHWDGGGMYNDGSSPTLANLTFTGNSASWGAGLYNNYNSSPVLTNCTFSGNSAEAEGGGIFNSFSSPVLTNCTFSGNTASSGGGMLNGWYSSPTLTNCILWGDASPEISNSEDSAPVVSYSDIQGGYPGGGNIDADPLFVDPANGDYHLEPGSPCIDAGTNDAPDPPGLPEYDFEGDPRVADSDHDGTATVDMGVDEVYEAPPAVIFVDHEAGGANNGTSWDDALTSFQAALLWAVDGVEIWVAEGTYVPTWRFDAGDPRSATFQMNNGVAIYGGFDPSAGDDTWEERDWQANPTILSGDVGTPDENSDNSYHVFYHPDTAALDSSAVLDGFTITGGNADGDVDPHVWGGGMYNNASTPTLANCTFADNSAIYLGGGMYNDASSPTLTNCTFAGNSAGNIGGGMYNYNSSSPTVTNSTFRDNAAGIYGGGMYNFYYSVPTLTNCTFTGNSADDRGGGMYNFYYSVPTLTNCTFHGNSANQGGGMYNDTSSPTLTNCSFLGNSASADGGGIHNGGNSSPTLTNCTFWGNSAGDSGGGIYNISNSSPTLTNCILWGDTAGGLPSEMIYDFNSVPIVTYSDVQGGYAGIGNIDAHPGFVDPDNGDLHLYPCSPCIDAGDNTATGLPPFDFEGDPRVIDGDGNGTAIVDMGMDEVAVVGTCSRIYLPLVLRGY